MLSLNHHPGTETGRKGRRGLRGRSRAALLLCLGAVSCSSTLAPATGDLSADLRHQDPRVRIDAAIKAVAQKRLELAAELVENLSDRDGAVRMFSAVALRKLTGQDFGYKPHGTLLEREEAVASWRAWLAAEGLTVGDGVPELSGSTDGGL